MHVELSILPTTEIKDFQILTTIRYSIKDKCKMRGMKTHKELESTRSSRGLQYHPTILDQSITKDI